MMAFFEESEVDRAYHVVKEKYPELWGALVEAEINYDENNREMWETDLRNTLTKEGFIYRSGVMFIFIAGIRGLIDVQYVPFLLNRENIPELRSRLDLSLPYVEQDVENAIVRLKEKYSNIWSTIEKIERYTPRAAIMGTISSTWFQVISVLKSEGFDYGPEFNGLFAQDIREKIQ